MNRTIEDVRHHPQVGDAVQKGAKLTRKVIEVKGNSITYRDQAGNEKCCWITTWQSWCLDAAVLPQESRPEATLE